MQEATISLDKLYYSIGEVAEMLNVNASLIRYWEKEFPGIKPRKNKKGNRNFTKEDIAYLRNIHYLVKERGMTLDGAKKHLKIASTTEEILPDTLQMLEKTKAFLMKLRSEL